VRLIASSSSGQVVFKDAPSSFNKGIVVEASGGIVLSHSVTTKGTATYLTAGTGTITVTATSTLSSTNQLLTLLADDVEFEVSSGILTGTAKLVLDTYTSGIEMGIGHPVKPYHLGDNELGALATEGGLMVGSNRSGIITIGGVSDGNSDAFAMLTLTATGSNGQVIFDSAASAFNKGVVVEAAAGIMLAESVTTKGSTAYLIAGTGTMTINAGKSLDSSGQLLQIAADDLNLAATSTVDTGIGKLSLKTYSEGRNISIGLVNPGVGRRLLSTGAGLYGVSDAELGVFKSHGGVTIGSSMSGSIAVGGITDSSTDTLATLTLVASRSGGQVVFNHSASSFNKGIVVEAASGIVLSQSVTTKGSTTYLTAGTAALTVEAAAALSTSDQPIIIRADDLILRGSLNSGSATTTITPVTKATIGVGDGSGQLSIDNTELRKITTTGLVIGEANVSGSIDVSTFSSANAAGINGMLTFIAMTDDSSITFSGNSSTFQAMMAYAEGGITTHSDLFISDDVFILDGDADKSPQGDTVNNVRFETGRIVSATNMILGAHSGAIQYTAPLHLVANTGLVMLSDFNGIFPRQPLALNVDSDADGDGMLTVAQGKVLFTNDGPVTITAWDIDLAGTLNAGAGSLTIHPSKIGESIGIGAVAQDMHISDDELVKMTARGSITIQRFGDGNVIVHSTSRKYATHADTVVFGGNYFTNPSYSSAIISSKYREANIEQLAIKVYSTVNDFEDPPGMGRLRVPPQVELGTNIDVEFTSDVYSARVTKDFDWIGLYRVGECDDDSDLNKDSVLHKCWLAWEYVPEGESTGLLAFSIQDYKIAGTYEARYFYGDSNGGQGYRCITLGNVGETYKHCLLRARATSNQVTVGTIGGTEASQSLPGLREHFCDAGNGLCTW